MEGVFYLFICAAFKATFALEYGTQFLCANGANLTSNSFCQSFTVEQEGQLQLRLLVYGAAREQTIVCLSEYSRYLTGLEERFLPSLNLLFQKAEAMERDISRDAVVLSGIDSKIDSIQTSFHNTLFRFEKKMLRLLRWVSLCLLPLSSNSQQLKTKHVSFSIRRPRAQAF